MNARTAPTTDELLAAVRHHAGVEHLRWATPPHPLTGGYWAEMYAVELADAPPHLSGPLVARIMPDPATAAFETAVQRHVHHHGLPVPAIRAASGPTAELDRAWTLMDHAPGHPLLTGLTASSALRNAHTLARRLPDTLAEATARLHHCPTVSHHLDDHRDRGDIRSFLQRIADQANDVGRGDLAASAHRLAERAPATRVICHGDLHPFNLLADAEHWTLLDWSAAVIADPHYDLAFTTLLLAHPPLGGPAPVRAIATKIGNRLSLRFLRTYSRLTGTAVDSQRLAWARTAHALRAMTELATWEHEDVLADRRDHPWLTLRPLFESQLAIEPMHDKRSGRRAIPINRQ